MTEYLPLRLPDTYLGGDRNFNLEYTRHGDIYLSFWNGGPVESAAAITNAKAYGLSHGNEAMLLAALIGFSIRAGVDSEHTRDTFVAAAEPLLQAEQHDFDEGRFLLPQMEDVANGEAIPIADRPSLDWQALIIPISSQPGRRERGATGIFTIVHEVGQLALIFAQVNSLSEKAGLTAAEAESATALDIDDVPLLAQTICQRAMENRHVIAKFIRQRFDVAS